MTKENILDCAVKVIAQAGFETASMDEIAKTANVAKGTLYYHFESKDEILSAIIERGIDRFVEILEQKLNHIAEPKKQLDVLIETQLDYFYEHKDFCKILLSEIWRLEAKWNKHIKQIQKKYLSTIQSIVDNGLDQKVFNQNLSSTATTSAVFSLIAFASLDWAIFHSQKSKKEMKETLKIIFFSGLIAN